MFITNIIKTSYFYQRQFGMISSRIKDKITTNLQPVYLEVINESHKHNVPANSETHFKVFVVSNAFESKSIIERHRMVNRILAEELKSPVHALSIKAITPEQYESDNNIQSTPYCAGGSEK